MVFISAEPFPNAPMTTQVPVELGVHTELTRSVLAQGSGSLVAAVPSQLTQLRGPGLATADVTMSAWAFLLWPGWLPVCCLA